MPNGESREDEDRPGNGVEKSESGEPYPQPSAPPAEQMVLDLETPLENLFSGIGCLGAMNAFLLLPLTLMSDLPEDRSWYGAILAGLVLLSIMGFALRSQVDNCYVLDFRRQELLFRRRLFAVERLTPMAAFGDLLATAVNGVKESSRREGVWWTYAAVLLTRSGRMVQITDYGKDDEGFQQAQETAKEGGAAADRFRALQAGIWPGGR